jgi:hypothetical protein
MLSHNAVRWNPDAASGPAARRRAVDTSAPGLTACPSCRVSSPIDSIGIVTMIEPPVPSPVTTDTMPAVSRISDSGSSRRRTMARATLSFVVRVSLSGAFVQKRGETGLL